MDNIMLVNLAGLIIGIVFGWVANKHNFCFHGGLRDFLQPERDNDGRLSAFLFAMAFAVFFTQATDMWITPLFLQQSIYLGTQVNFIALIVGGGLFGVGMMLAKGCGSRHLIKLSQGNLSSILVLLMLGMFSYAAIAGVFAEPLNWLQAEHSVQMTSQSLMHIVAHYFDVDTQTARLLTTVALLVFLLTFGYRFRDKRRTWFRYWDSLLIGVLVTTGWICTSLLQDDFDPVAVQSISFTLPLGKTLQFFMFFSGYALDFGIAVVLGVLLGAFATNLFSTRKFTWTGVTSAKEYGNALAGGALMGLGGVMAIGCNIGQGITGISTLSVGSLVAISAIAVSGALVSKLSLA